MSLKRVVGPFAGSGASQYHLRELEIALDPNRPEHAMPPFLPPPAKILDIGCGAGQTLIAGYPDRVSFGIDVDPEALSLGRTLTDRVRFVRGIAEALPFRRESFDLVVARVSLPYTYLAESLTEIYRVLKHGGQLWAALHPFRMSWDQAYRGGSRAKFNFMYVVINSLLFHWSNRQFKIGQRCESFQTCRGIHTALTRCGFREVSIDLNPQQFLVTARKP